MLLGQAESGKSTLQKQFQLYYASQTLDRERPAWRPIVYSNILKAIRTIFDALDFPLAPSPVPEALAASLYGGSSSDSSSAPTESLWSAELVHLRSKLLPLVASEDALAAELSGGVRVGGGRSGVYVRAGWQALITPNRAWPVTDIRNAVGRPTVVANLVGKTLSATQDEIMELWHNPVVRKLLAANKLRLEESAALCVGADDGAAAADDSLTT